MRAQISGGHMGCRVFIEVFISNCSQLNDSDMELLNTLMGGIRITKFDNSAVGGKLFYDDVPVDTFRKHLEIAKWALELVGIEFDIVQPSTSMTVGL